MNLIPLKYPVLISFALIFRGLLFAQNDTLEFNPVTNPVIQQMNIWNICVARDGKLWLSNDNGVASFDGNDVRFYGHGEGGNPVMGHKITVMSAFDHSENIYCLIAGGFLYHMNTRTGKFLNPKNKIDGDLAIHVQTEDSSRFFSPRSYTSIYTDNDQSLWCGRTNMGFIHYEPSTRTTTVYDLTKLNKGANTVFAIQHDLKDANLLWLATDNGICSFNKTTRQLQRKYYCKKTADSSSSDLNISNIIVNHSDTIWFVAQQKGVGYYLKSTGGYSIIPYKKQSSLNESTELKIINFQEKGNNEFYLGLENDQPCTFNIITRQYAFKTKIHGNFPGLKFRQVIADSSGNVWCILFGRLFVAMPNKNKFRTIILKDINQHNEAVNIFKTVIWDTARKCYYAAFDNSDGLFVLDSNRHYVRSIGIESPESKSVRETHVYDIALDNKGRLWSCGDFLSLYNPASKRMMIAGRKYPQLSFSGLRFQNLVARGDYLYLQPSGENSLAIYRINTTSLHRDSISIPQEIISADQAKITAEKQMDVLVIDKKGRYAYMGIHKTVIQIDLLTKTIRKLASIRIKQFELFYNMFWYTLDDDDNLWISDFEILTSYEPVNLQPVKSYYKEDGTYHINLCNARNKGILCVLYSRGVILYDYRSRRQYHLGLVDGLNTLYNSGIACANNTIFVGAELSALQWLPLSSAIDNNRERFCYISGIEIFGKPYYSDSLPEYLHTVTLPHDQNSIGLTFSCIEMQQASRIIYRYKLEGQDETWRFPSYLNNSISYNNLHPGNYTFYATVLNWDDKWSRKRAVLSIHILPAWWQTGWFRILALAGAVGLAWLLIIWRIRVVRKQEQIKSRYEKDLLELEAQALRAQMNPHFIFNCMNSIKSLIQQKENSKAVIYLTTFSKLIRTIFQNSDKREVTLFDEIETCRLYTELESMRFGNKFSYSFDIDEAIDLKSVFVPALIIQPFIENAIWHGIMPKSEGGRVNITIRKTDDVIFCTIDDDGIGREMSAQNKFRGDISSHQSRGVHLTQSRIDLNNLLNQHSASLENNR